MSIRQFTQQEIEWRYKYSDRIRAVITMVHARDYLLAYFTVRNPAEYPNQSHVNAIEILNDGILNAIDGRATGNEFRTLRHSYLAHTDPQNYPSATDRDPRCQQCGYVDPLPFTHCPHQKRIA